MKILTVTQGYYPTIGGIEWMVQRVSEEMLRQFGDEVTVFTTNCYNGEGFFNPKVPRYNVGWEEHNQIKVRRFPVLTRVSQIARKLQGVAYRLQLPFNEQLRSLSGGPVIPGLGKEIRKYPADLVLAASFPLMHMHTALESAHATHRPCVMVGGLHPVDDWGFNRPGIYRAIQAADYYIALTGFEQQYVIERGAKPEKVAAIGLGVDPEVYGDIQAEDAKRRLGLEGKNVVGFIGQLGGHKGIDTLIRAMPAIWQVRPDTYFLIAGARALFADKMEQMIAEFPQENRQKIVLHYNFPEKEKPWLFAAVDVFAYPSGFESFGIAFLEAWMMNKPVIGCRAGAVPWVVEAGRDGLLINYQDQDMLAETILTLIQNPGYCQILGQAGHRKVLADYTWPLVAQRFREVYQQARQSYD